MRNTQMLHIHELWLVHCLGAGSLLRLAVLLGVHNDRTMERPKN